jgi:hypothetical protein
MKRYIVEGNADWESTRVVDSKANTTESSGVIAEFPPVLSHLTRLELANMIADKLNEPHAS